MAKVFSASDIAAIAPARPARSRGSAASFGAPAGAALEGFGNAIGSLGKSIDVLAESRQGATDKDFLIRFGIESEDAIDRAATEADYQNPGVVDRLGQTFEQTEPAIIERLRGEGYRPSEQAIERANLIHMERSRRQLRKAAVNEHNLQVVKLADNASTSLARVALRGGQSGDFGATVGQVEGVLDEYRDVLDPSTFRDVRDAAAKSLIKSFDERPEELNAALNQLISDRVIEPEAGTGQLARPQSQAQANDAAIAAISVRLETGKSDPLQGVGQVAKDSGGSKSYGNFGLNSGGSAQQFVAQYGGPFGLTAEPGTEEFDEQWRNAASAAPVELHAAEMDWYGKTVLSDIGAKLKGAGLPDDVASDPRVKAYFADRSIQQGTASIDGMDKHKARIKAAYDASGGDVPAFLRSITEADRDAMTSDFPTALKTGVYSEEGHDNRIDGRLRMALSITGDTQAAADTLPDDFRGSLARGLIANAPKIREKLLERREEAAARQRLQGLITGQILADPGSKEDRDLIDDAVSKTDLGLRLNAGDSQAVAEVTALVKNTGYVPENALSNLRAMAVNGSPEQKTLALETAANLMRVKPGALEGSEKAKRLREDADLYDALTSEMGLDAPAAIQRITETHTPEFKKRREALEKDAGKLVKDITADEIVGEFGGWFTSTPDLGSSPRRSGLVLDAYRTLVRDGFIRTGDADVARAVAKKELLRTYGVSTVTGNKRLMRHPPEKHYPPIAENPGDAPGFEYFTRQLHEAVNEAAGRVEAIEPGTGLRAETGLELIPIEDIYIEPVAQTSTDIRAGRPPGYGVVWFEEKDGVRSMETAPGMVFRADVKAEHQRVSLADEQRTRDSRRREIERQKELETSIFDAFLHPERALLPVDEAPPPEPEKPFFAMPKRSPEKQAIRDREQQDALDILDRVFRPEKALRPIEPSDRAPSGKSRDPFRVSTPQKER